VNGRVERLLLIRERRFLLGLMFVTGIAALWLVRGFVAWAVLGLLLGYICLPMQRRLVGWKLKPVLAAALVMTLVTLAIAIPIGLLVASVASDVARIAADVQANGFPSYLHAGLVKVMPEEMATTLAEDLGRKIPEYIADLVPEAILAFVDATVGIFILASALFAVLLRGDELMKWLHRIVPLRPDREEAFFHEIQRALDAVIYGVVVVAAILAVFGGIIWYFAGLPSVLFFTAVMFIFSMIPALGPSFVLLPGAIYAYLSGNTTGAIILIIGTFIGIGAIDYVIRPWIIQKKGELEPTLTLLAIVGGVATMGIIGIFVGPLIVAIFLHVTELTMATHKHFGGDYDAELFDWQDPIAGEPPAEGAGEKEPKTNEPA
jgi:predicted PurR-regulated permease PerM